MNFKICEITEIDRSAVDLIGSEWMLITAGDDEKYNSMTASWGSLGEMWGKHVATVVIRPQRYTKEFVDDKEHFTLCFFGKGDDAKAIHKVCGSKSGRDVDKTELTGLTPVYDGEFDTVYYEEAELVIICKKLYAKEFDPEAFIDKSCLDTYKAGDFHTQYFGEIMSVLVRD